VSARAVGRGTLSRKGCDVERFQGDLLWGGRVVAENVTGGWERHAGGGRGAWSGYLRSATSSSLRPGRAYVLVLDDGRSATIRVGPGAGRPGSLPFEGVGPWL
jgi:hypothetical protein